VKVGIWLFPNSTPLELVRSIELAEQLGVDEVWLGDEGPSGWDPFAVCAAAAMRTSTVILGVAVANPITRHPAATALGAMTIHALSGGRFRLAYGPGGSLPLGPLDLSVTSPVSTMLWALTMSRGVASGKAVADLRPGYSYTPNPDACVVTDLPIWVGARGPRLNAVAGQHADGVFLSGIDRFQLPVVAQWARDARAATVSTSSLEVATYLTACMDPTLVVRYAPGFVHALAEGPENSLERLGLTRLEVREASTALTSGDDTLARALMNGDILDSVLATGPASRIAELVRRSAAETAATSCGVAIIGEDPVRDVSGFAEVFRLIRSGSR
jgi:5,10-methylenetetrahydromethanopterin reductase